MPSSTGGAFALTYAAAAHWGAAAAAKCTAIANWASSIPPAQPPFTFPPPEDDLALDKLSSALRSLHMARFHINAGRNTRGDRARNHGTAARCFLDEMARCVGEAKERLVAFVGQPGDYVDGQLRAVLIDAGASERSTFGDFRVAGRSCEHAKWRLERVVGMMRRECV